MLIKQYQYSNEGIASTKSRLKYFWNTVILKNVLVGFDVSYQSALLG